MSQNPVISKAIHLWNQGQTQQAYQILVDYIEANTPAGKDPTIKEAANLWKKKQHKQAILALAERVKELGEIPEASTELSTTASDEHHDTTAGDQPHSGKDGLSTQALTTLGIATGMVTLGLIVCVILLLTSTKSLQKRATRLERSVELLQTKVKIVDDSVSRAFSDIRTIAAGLDYVTPLAENADFHAHSHSYSDERLKTGVQDIPAPLERVLSLRGVQFEWDIETFPEMDFEDGKQIGFIAQEVEQIFPELVTTDTTGYKMIDYAKLTVVLVEALKEQQLEIETLEQQIALIQGESK